MGVGERSASPAIQLEDEKATQYKPWPEDVTYVPGVGDAPQLKKYVGYGETPKVGDVPRIGKRPGDPRCNDGSGITPCHLCVYEQARKYKYDSKVMPGLPSAEAVGRNPITGMPFSHPHPFRAPTREMNTGRGCDTHGKPYLPPHRFEYIKIHRFDDEQEDYMVDKEYELDWGPELGSAEFQQGSREWQQTAAFKEYEERMQTDNPEWRWQDPVEEKPWESIELEDPNPWLNDDFIIEEPIDQHVKLVQDWANEPHRPWPDVTPSLESTAREKIEDAQFTERA
mmetsp:Transcript_22009/g.39966  ORF Transcript_22009/g.39966 Transcript_22009/m.39966 type:complete len:283 (-) Transcript_22009:49-897(-)